MDPMEWNLLLFTVFATLLTVYWQGFYFRGRAFTFESKFFCLHHANLIMALGDRLPSVAFSLSVMEYTWWTSFSISRCKAPHRTCSDLDQVIVVPGLSTIGPMMAFSLILHFRMH